MYIIPRDPYSCRTFNAKFVNIYIYIYIQSVYDNIKGNLEIKYDKDSKPYLYNVIANSEYNFHRAYSAKCRCSISSFVLCLS